MVELQKQGQNKGNWRNVLLSKVLKERDERNTNLYQVFLFLLVKVLLIK